MTEEEKRDRKRAYDITWRAANREKVKAHHAAYYARHKEQHDEAARAYQKTRPELKARINKKYNDSEKGKATMAAWQAKNKEARRIKERERRKALMRSPQYRAAEAERTRQRTLNGEHRAYDKSIAGKSRRVHSKAHRRSRIRGSTAADAKVAVQKILSQKDPKCFYCQRVLKPGSVTIDHIRALSKGGQHAAFNLVPACVDCNRRKGAKDANEFIASGQQILVF